MKIAVFVVICFLFSFAIAEDTLVCSELEVDTDLDQPINGTDLKYCKVNQLQCCDDSYFDQRRQQISQQVKDDLRDILNEQLEKYDDIVDAVEYDLKKRFIPLFSENFCGVVGGDDCDLVTATPRGNLLAHLLIQERDDESDDSDTSDKTGDSDTSDKTGDSDTSDKTGDSDTSDKTGDSDTSDKTGDSDTSDKTDDSDTSDTSDTSDDSDKTDDSDTSDTSDTSDDSDTSDSDGMEEEFTTDEIVDKYADSTVDGIIEYYVKPRASSLSDSHRICLRDSLQVRRDRLNDVVRNFTQIRLAISALIRLRNYVKSTVVSKILSVRPANSCISSFINLRCKECIEDIPDTCRGACNAVVYACIAPYSVGLRKQFNLLWNATNQIVDITSRLLTTTGSLSQSLFNINISNKTTLNSLFRRRCNLILTDDNSARRKRTEGSDSVTETEGSDGTDSDTTDDDEETTDDDKETTGDDKETTGDSDDDDEDDDEDDEDDEKYRLPEAITSNSSQLLNSGIFNYYVPNICKDLVNTNCWNGSANVSVNNVMFNNQTIAGQRDNPVYQYNETELAEVANSFGPVIADYLMTDSFQSVAPRGLALNNITFVDPNSASAMFGCTTLILISVVLGAIALF